MLMVAMLVKWGKKTSPCSCPASRCWECTRSGSPCSTLGQKPYVFSCKRGRTEVVKYGLADEALLGIFS